MSTKVIEKFEMMFNINEPIPCTHSMHGKRADTHQGNATWLLSTECPKCGDRSTREPRCNKFVMMVMSGQLGMVCVGCKQKVTFFRDAVTGMERI